MVNAFDAANPVTVSSPIRERREGASQQSVDLLTAAPVVCALYLGLMAVLLIRLAIIHSGARRLKRKLVPVDDPRMTQALQAGARYLGLKRLPAIGWCERVIAPSLLGVLRPVILLPVSTLAGLTPKQLEGILAHELAHIRRHDYLVNLIQRVFETLLFYHPAVWWLSRRIRLEREQCCDDLAAEACGDPVVLARALISRAA